MDGALIRPATDRVQDGDSPPFFTEEALLRLEERLRAQRVQQEGWRFLGEDARSQQACLPAGESEPQEPADTRFADPTLGLVDRQLEAFRRESFDARHHLLAPAFARFRAKARELTRQTRGRDLVQIVKELFVYLMGWRGYFELDNWLQRRWRAIGWKQWKLGSKSSRPKIRAIGSPPSGRRQKLSLLVLIVGVAALGVSLKARTGGSTNAASVNIEGRGRTASVPPENPEPRQSFMNAVKSSAATTMPSLPPDNHVPQSITNAGKSSVASVSLPPLPRDRPANNRSKRKGPPHQPTPATRSLPRDNDEIGQLIMNAVKSTASPRSSPR
jgi:hypothetical protein